MTPAHELPAAFWLLTTDADSAASHGLASGVGGELDIVTIDLRGSAAPIQDAVDAIRSHGAGRWIVVAPARALTLASSLVDRVLSGQALVFGLSGLVRLVENATEGAQAPDLPTFVLPTRSLPPRSLPTRSSTDLGSTDLGSTDLAALVLTFWREQVGIAPAVPSEIGRVIASERTSARTRGILARRALPDAPDASPRALSVAELKTLRSVAARVVPQTGAAIDLALRLDAQLAESGGDGWRNADLPADLEAYSSALTALAGFELLNEEEQDDKLRAIADLTLDLPFSALDAHQLSVWFEDVRADLVRLWLAHPATLARIGFDGFANGGDGVRKQGFTLLGANEREGWEPELLGLRPVTRAENPKLNPIQNPTQNPALNQEHAR